MRKPSAATQVAAPAARRAAAIKVCIDHALFRARQGDLAAGKPDGQWRRDYQRCCSQQQPVVPANEARQTLRQQQAKAALQCVTNVREQQQPAGAAGQQKQHAHNNWQHGALHQNGSTRETRHLLIVGRGRRFRFGADQVLEVLRGSVKTHTRSVGTRPQRRSTHACSSAPAPRCLCLRTGDRSVGAGGGRGWLGNGCGLTASIHARNRYQACGGASCQERAGSGTAGCGDRE